MTAQVMQSLWNHEENQIDREDSAELCCTTFPHTHTHTLIGLKHLCFSNIFVPVLTLTNRPDFLKLKTPSAKGKPATPA